MYHQNDGTAMGTPVAPPFANLVIYPNILPNHFSISICKLIEECNKRFMDDGFTPLATSIATELFKNCLNSMYRRIRYTIEPERKTVTENENVQTINFLDITIILHENNEIETEIYYKETNSHDYLDFRRHHA